MMVGCQAPSWITTACGQANALGTNNSSRSPRCTVASQQLFSMSS